MFIKTKTYTVVIFKYEKGKKTTNDVNLRHLP